MKMQVSENIQMQMFEIMRMQVFFFYWKLQQSTYQFTSTLLSIVT